MCFESNSVDWAHSVAHASLSCGTVRWMLRPGEKRVFGGGVGRATNLTVAGDDVEDDVVVSRPLFPVPVAADIPAHSTYDTERRHSRSHSGSDRSASHPMNERTVTFSDHHQLANSRENELSSFRRSVVAPSGPYITPFSNDSSACAALPSLRPRPENTTLQSVQVNGLGATPATVAYTREMDRLRAELKQRDACIARLRADNDVLSKDLTETRQQMSAMVENFQSQQASLAAAIERVQTQQVDIDRLREVLRGEVTDNDAIRHGFVGLLQKAQSELKVVRDEIAFRERKELYSRYS